MMNDGGPAFPQEIVPAGRDFHEGMSLRQWYAGVALAALNWTNLPIEDHFAKEVARSAFMIADAMIAQESESASV
jgi:hypothetical protein